MRKNIAEIRLLKKAGHNGFLQAIDYIFDNFYHSPGLDRDIIEVT